MADDEMCLCFVVFLSLLRVDVHGDAVVCGADDLGTDHDVLGDIVGVSIQ